MRYKGTTVQRLDRIERAILGILHNQRSLFEGEIVIMSQLTDALDRAEAAATRDIDAHSAMEGYIASLSAQVKALGAGSTDPAVVTRINALADALNSRADAAATAVLAGTPADPEAPTGGQSTGGARPID